MAGRLASAYRFPYLGGEFHAMFAGSDGYLPAAYLAFSVHVGTVCAVAALLVAGGYRLPWGVVALAAAVTAGGYWWHVYTWPRGQSEVFHRTSGLLFIAIPVIAFAACAAAHALRRRVVNRPPARRGRRRSRSGRRQIKRCTPSANDPNAPPPGSRDRQRRPTYA
jgi:hypothetical protein